ncbi:MAG: hypothetical protein MRJ93_05295 [Nitrososphaeraceae archaeon]|nr:hypothetical protein [Nitrososphaeraceae archaeon]
MGMFLCKKAQSGPADRQEVTNLSVQEVGNDYSHNIQVNSRPIQERIYHNTKRTRESRH